MPWLLGIIYNHVSLFSRQPGEDSEMLVCDACDKGYHTFCLQPAMESLPSEPWKCGVSYFDLHANLELFVENSSFESKWATCLNSADSMRKC